MSEHDCIKEDNFEYLKNISSQRSKKYKCKTCNALYRRRVSHFDRVMQDYIPYKCCGKPGIECMNKATLHTHDKFFCEQHKPKRITPKVKRHKHEVDKSIDSFKQLEANRNVELRLETFDYSKCKDNFCGYLEL